LIAKWAKTNCIVEFELAAKGRSLDATCLNRGRRSYWGIYTTGYVFEMLLKAAYFRVVGRSERHDLMGPNPKTRDLNKETLKQRASALKVQITPKNLHDIVFWADLLIAERNFIAISGTMSPMSSTIANRLAANAKIVAQHWREDMRYWRPFTAASAFRKVVKSTVWLKQNYKGLWS